jgi:hypothetical protein
MTIRSWLRNRFAARTARSTGKAPARLHRPRRLCPVLEILEDRLLLNGLITGPVAAAYGQLPLSFEANQGQTAAGVSFLAHGADSTLFLTQSGTAVLSLDPQGTQPGDVLEMRLQGANPSPAVSGQDLLPGVSNYLTGSDPSGWHTDIANYAAVDYQGVYAGIDLRYHGNARHLEYDFVVAAGADPGQIRLGFAGVEGLSLDGQGDLVLQTAAGAVTEQAPVLYQQNADGTRTAVSGGYVLEGDGTVGFQVGAYDSSQALVIDPVLAYSTYLGGSGADEGHGIAVDGSGDAYVTGVTNSVNFPTTAGAFQTALGSARRSLAAQHADSHEHPRPRPRFPAGRNRRRPQRRHHRLLPQSGWKDHHAHERRARPHQKPDDPGSGRRPTDHQRQQLQLVQWPFLHAGIRSGPEHHGNAERPDDQQWLRLCVGVVCRPWDGYGGGILNHGTLTVSACTIDNSHALNEGGGIFSDGTLTVSDCTVSGNSAAYGAGIANSGTAVSSAASAAVMFTMAMAISRSP